MPRDSVALRLSAANIFISSRDWEIKYNDFAISSKLPANSHLPPCSRMKGAAISVRRNPPADLEPGRRFDIEPARKNVAHLEDRYLPMDPRRLFVPHLHTHRRTHTRARIARRAHCAVDAVTMQSPMQFRAIQVRLALCTSDMVTVYPSPTHTRIRARSSKTRPSRTDASDDTYGRRRWGELQLWMQPSWPYVPLLREVEDG